MKDYSFSFGKKEEYYLYYEKENDKLIVHMAGGKTKEMENTSQNEESIISKMEEQLMSDEDFYIDYYSEDFETAIKGSFPFLVLSCSNTIFSFNNSDLFNLISYGVLAISSIAFSIGGVAYGYSSMLQKDFDKHKLFYDNKQLINKHLKGDLRPLKGFNKKLLKAAKENAENNQETLNINTIRLMKMKELKKLLEGIEEKERAEKELKLKMIDE